MAKLKEVQIEHMAFNSSQTNLEMSLDLLVARASLDRAFRNELLHNAKKCCIENGIKIPEGTQIIFTSAESSLVVKEIPIVNQDKSTIEKINGPLRRRPTVGSGNEEVESAIETQAIIQTGAQTNTAMEVMVE
tara:strand:- start:59 stop:457 length:399 start_codon:yes stop_codon:yes gene_type:complete